MRYHSVGIAAQIPGEREKAPHVVARARAITCRYPVRVLPAEYPEVLWFIKLKEGLSLSQLSYKTGVLYVQFTVSCEIGCLIVTHFPHFGTHIPKSILENIFWKRVFLGARGIRIETCGTIVVRHISRSVC